MCHQDKNRSHMRAFNLLLITSNKQGGGWGWTEVLWSLWLWPSHLRHLRALCSRSAKRACPFLMISCFRASSMIHCMIWGDVTIICSAEDEISLPPSFLTFLLDRLLELLLFWGDLCSQWFLHQEECRELFTAVFVGHVCGLLRYPSTGAVLWCCLLPIICRHCLSLSHF